MSFHSNSIPRHPSRIGPTLAALRTYWEQNPDLRLGQIVGNRANGAGIDPYSLEGDALVGLLGRRDGPSGLR